MKQNIEDYFKENTEENIEIKERLKMNYHNNNKLKMDKKYSPKDVAAIDLAIKKMIVKYGALSEPSVLCRAMWNLFTNANGERERAKKIIGRFLRNETIIDNIDKYLFTSVKDVKVSD